MTLDDGSTATSTITSRSDEFFSFAVDGSLAQEVIAKGGPDANVYDYSDFPGGGIAHDDGLSAREKSPRKPYGLSHVSFCLTPEPPPTIAVDKTAAPTSVAEPGGDVTYTVTVANTAVESVTIDTLDDDLYGSLAGDDDCQVGTPLPAGGSCTFQFTEPVAGNAGDTITDVVTATARDDEGNTATDSDDATVTIRPLGQVTPTGTECTDFASFEVDDLGLVEYGVDGSLIGNTSPGVFFYYSKVIAPAESFTIDIAQSTTHPSFSALFGINNDQIELWEADCTKSKRGASSSPAAGQARIDVSGATAGEVFYVSVKYDTSTVVNEPVPDPPTVHYDYTTVVDGQVTTFDEGGVDLAERSG